MNFYGTLLNYYIKFVIMFIVIDINVKDGILKP